MHFLAEMSLLSSLFNCGSSEIEGLSSEIVKDILKLLPEGSYNLDIRKTQNVNIQVMIPMADDPFL